MKLRKLSIILLSFLILSSCGKTYSLVDVGSSHEDILVKYDISYSDYLKDSYISKDTLIYIYNFVNQPFETLLLFQNDNCYYQEINMYCSVCYDKAIEAIKKDSRYKFKVVDEANYISTKLPHIVMRMKDNTDQIESCSKIRIIDTSVRK